VKSDKLEIGRILHLKSKIKNLKLDWEVDSARIVQFEIFDFGFEMQDSSDFEFVRFPDSQAAYGFPNFACSARIFSSIVCAGAWTTGRTTGLGLETGVVFSRTGRGALAAAFLT
jgi:hypothetical protein